ncbi:hypothetical protein CTI12_AA225670 [Artemisia annua]|uniref:Uncharacterized protein n=1 Tax=Artemisia annua TaxID=35608 RepID=A0A2U1NUI4_ARTAN|nr:hypothetical protein CTI12_AA225670 [Artemisia annua]
MGIWDLGGVWVSLYKQLTGWLMILNVKKSVAVIQTYKIWNNVAAAQAFLSSDTVCLG